MGQICFRWGGGETLLDGSNVESYITSLREGEQPLIRSTLSRMLSCYSVKGRYTRKKLPFIFGYIHKKEIPFKIFWQPRKVRLRLDQFQMDFPFWIGKFLTLRREMGSWKCERGGGLQ